MDELLVLLRRYLVDGSLMPVRDWLYGHVDELFSSPDEELRGLADVVWSRISDYEACDIDEAAVRRAVEAELARH